jgi:hypothetical protein
VIDYEGRRFVRPGDESGTVAVYHQSGAVVWAEVAGGRVERGFTAGTADPDGTLRLGYAIVLAGGELLCGHSVSTPGRTADGRLQLREQWQRFRPEPAAGVSFIEELRG